MSEQTHDWLITWADADWEEYEDIFEGTKEQVEFHVELMRDNDDIKSVEYEEIA